MAGPETIPGKNDLASLFPEIAAEWDPEKNGSLTPEQVLPGSGRRIFWICREGHSWKTAVYHRTRGHGCPWCSARAGALKRGVNDLLTVNPGLAAQWHETKNGGLGPSEVTAHSMRKVWWQCRKGHEWKASVNKRQKGTGCPYCAGNRILPGYNDLVSTGAPFLPEWDHEKNGDLIPETFGRGSNRKVWWKCSKGHNWEASVYSRTAGSGCPYCAGNTVVPGVNDIRSRMPEWVAEWDFARNGTGPEKTAVTSAKKVWWKCGRGHSYRSSPACRIRGHGCVYCAGRKVLPGFNDFASGYPGLLEEWDYRKNRIDPSEITRSSNRRVWWKDCHGHEWLASVADRSAGTGCPYCSGRMVLLGFNDLAGRHPDIAREWDTGKNGGLRPEDVTYGSNRTVWWRCGQGHSWRASVAARTGGGHGCPYCGNRKAWPGFNDLLSCLPVIAREWDHLKNGSLMPDEVTYRTGRLVWWQCGKGHSYRMSVYGRWKGQGCPYCGGRKVLSGFNDLRTAAPWIAEEWDSERNGSLKPDNVFPYTNRKVWWKCENGHHWKSTVNSRQKGAGCPYCHGLIPRTPHFIS